MDGRIKRSRASMVVGLTLVLAGCPIVPGPTDPCDDDLLDCLEDLSFELDDDCSAAEQMGELDVSLGEGEKTFVALGAQQLPYVYRGAQGGQHMLLGARIANPNPGRERALLEFSVTLFEDEVGSRPVVITSDVWEEGASGLEIYGLLVFLGGWAEDGTARVRVDVTDACGRTGFDERVME